MQPCTIVYVFDVPSAALRRARAHRGLSQAAFARRAGIDQPMVSAYEHGRRDPSWRTFDRLIRAAGAVIELRIQPLPDDSFTLADLAPQLASAKDDSRRRRLVLEFIQRFWDAPPDERCALLVDPPASAADRHWDALVSALAEHLAFHEATDPPAWCTEPDRFLDHPWYWVDLPSVRRRALTGAPTAFRRRNVWLDRVDLERV